MKYYTRCVCVCLCDLTCPGLVNANVARGTRRALFRITYIKLEYVHVYCIVRYPIQCASIHEGDKINGNVIYSNDPYGEIYNDRFWHTASKHFLFIRILYHVHVAHVSLYQEDLSCTALYNERSGHCPAILPNGHSV